MDLKHMSMRSTRSTTSSVDTFESHAMLSKEGRLKSQKYVGMNHKVKKNWVDAQVKVFNNVLIVDYNMDGLKNGEIPISWEVQLSGLKLVIGPSDESQFSVIAKRESTHLIEKVDENIGKKKKQRGSTVRFGMEEVLEDEGLEAGYDLKSMLTHKKEEDLMGDSKDVCFLFKAPNVEVAKDWVELFKMIQKDLKESADTPEDTINEKHKSLAASLSVYSKGSKNILSQTRSRRTVRGGKLAKNKKGKKKKMQEVDLTAEADIDNTPDWLKDIYAFGRFLVFGLSFISILFVGSVYLAYLTLTNASEKERRKASTMLEDILVNSLIWISPKVRINVTGEAPTSYTGPKKATDTPKIIVMNRSTQVDFFYACILANEVGHAGYVRAILKKEIRYVPVVGTVLSWFRFLFLSGDEESDDLMIEAYMTRMGESRRDWLVFFPEQSHPNHKELQKSRRIAEEENRPVLKKLVLPDAEILESCLSHINNGFTEIYDLTIQYQGYSDMFYVNLFMDHSHPFLGYSGEVPMSKMGFDRERDVSIPTFMKLLNGRASSNIHIDSRKWSLKDVTEHPDGVQGWLDESWDRKDSLMSYFIKNQRFPSEDGSDVFTAKGSITEMLQLWAITIGSCVGFTVLILLVGLINRLTS